MILVDNGHTKTQSSTVCPSSSSLLEHKQREMWCYSWYNRFKNSIHWKLILICESYTTSNPLFMLKRQHYIPAWESFRSANRRRFVKKNYHTQSWVQLIYSKICFLHKAHCRHIHIWMIKHIFALTPFFCHLWRNQILFHIAPPATMLSWDLF